MLAGDGYVLSTGYVLPPGSGQRRLPGRDMLKLGDGIVSSDGQSIKTASGQRCFVLGDGMQSPTATC